MVNNITREEAIKEAYGIPVTKAQHEALQILIPELAENDDERIRKALCDIVQDMPYMETELRAHGLTVEKTLAYLEKQKQQKNFQTKVQQRMEYLWDKLPDSHKVENGDCTPEEWKTLGAYMELEMNFDKDSEEEQNEQKPWKVGANAYFTPEPKPALSEEDKEAIDKNLLTAAIAFVDLNPYNYWCGIDKRKVIKVLRSLHPQSNQEWSEEDERMLSRCVKSIESSKNFADSQTFKEAKDKEKEWLISLPERFNLQEVREQYPIEDCDYGLEIALDILVKSLNKVQGYQTDDGIREHQTAIQAVKDAMKPWSYPYGKNKTVDNLIGIAECLEMDGDCMFNGMSGDDCGQFLRDLARKEVE